VDYYSLPVSGAQQLHPFTHMQYRQWVLTCFASPNYATVTSHIHKVITDLNAESHFPITGC